MPLSTGPSRIPFRQSEADWRVRASRTDSLHLVLLMQTSAAPSATDGIKQGSEWSNPARRWRAQVGSLTQVAGDIIRYRKLATLGGSMPDVLIRDLPDDVLAAIDAKARRVGLSRTEYIRRVLAGERGGATGGVSVEDLVAFADTFTDLADSDVMRQAWS